MSRAPSCSECRRELKPHCPDRRTSDVATRCTWWRCSNTNCPANIHDFSRGLRILTNGTRERFTPQG